MGRKASFRPPSGGGGSPVALGGTSSGATKGSYSAPSSDPRAPGTGSSGSPRSGGFSPPHANPNAPSSLFDIWFPDENVPPFALSLFGGSRTILSLDGTYETILTLE